ncbi:hypothetical protein P885DRAFT_25469 [Corynascus similis CBS 632.67]
MLNKKSAFKPKAGIRRPAVKPGSQGNSHPSTREPSSNTTPAPQDPSSSIPQPAPQSTPSAPLEVNPRSSAEGTAEGGRTSLQIQGKQSRPGVTELVQGTSTTSIPPASSLGVNGESAVTTSKEIPVIEPAASQPEESVTQGISTVPNSDLSSTPVVTSGSSSKPSTDEQTPATVSAAVAATSSSGHANFSPEILSTTPSRSITPANASVSATTPISPPNDQTTISETQPTQTAAAPIRSAISHHSQSNSEATVETVPNSSRTIKAKRSRKRTTTAELGGDPSEQSSTGTSKRIQQKRVGPSPGEEGSQPATPRATSSRKRSASATENGELEDDAEGNIRQPKRRPPRPQRETTPPDAEHVEIDITQVKMADLAKDMHIGKKFSLHDELMERERAKRLRYNERKKRQQTGEDGEESPVADGDARGATPSSNPNTSSQHTPAVGANGSAAESQVESSTRAPIGETYQIIDGEIVLDHRSLQVDRHARAREEAGELVEVEENDFTHHTTSATYLRRNLKPQQWTDEETELFYQALQAFGTDFDTICRMFKGKTRKHIKLKFNREERVNPQRITAALVGQKTVSIDMEQYQRATGQEYETAEAIYAEQRKAEEEFEARQKALEDEKAEEVRRKKEEVLAQLNSAVDGDGTKKGGRKGRKKKAPVVMGL